MNINTLEKIARQVVKGSDVAEKSNEMLNSGTITPTEHRSVQSLSWQIAANVQANGGAAAGTLPYIKPAVAWL